MKRTTILLITFFLLGVITIAFAQSGGTRKKRPRSDEYGNVLNNNFSKKNNIAPSVFNHWLHRARYTCRLCHVDIGFAMEAGETAITENDNLNGLYCGACHNGKEAFGPKESGLFGKAIKANCDRCHSHNKKIKFEKDFYEFTQYFPRSRFGDKIDWLKTEEKGLIKLKDYLKDVSVKRDSLKYSVDKTLKAKIKGMPDILFSHQKHAVWNGCELCHPDIFGIKKGSTIYSMQDIFEGKYCGSCHGKVAFPNLDCRLCHTKDVY